MDDIGVPNDDTTAGFSLRRPSRAERAVDDPIREMEGMLVDEYGRSDINFFPCTSLYCFFFFFWPPVLEGLTDNYFFTMFFPLIYVCSFIINNIRLLLDNVVLKLYGTWIMPCVLRNPNNLVRHC